MGAKGGEMSEDLSWSTSPRKHWRFSNEEWKRELQVKHLLKETMNGIVLGFGLVLVVVIMFSL